MWSWGYTSRPQEMCPEEPLWKGWGRPSSPYSSLPQVPAATCPALRASGEPTAATPAPARTGAPASPRVAIVCVCLDSEVPPASDVRLPPHLPPASRGTGSCQKPLSSPSCFLPLTPIFGPVGRKEGGSGIQGGLPPITRSPFLPACQPGRYGKRCVPCKCANHSSCHPSNGTCYCLAGWTGSDCSQGTWWLVCLRACACPRVG